MYRIEHTRSPLPYNHSARVHRMQIVMPDAGPPRDSDSYFSPTATQTVRGKKITLPPADKNVVAFLDWHEDNTYGPAVVIDFMKTRQDFSRIGLATTLIDELYATHADKKEIDWGKIMSDYAEKLFHKTKKKFSAPRTRGKLV